MAAGMRLPARPSGLRQTSILDSISPANLIGEESQNRPKFSMQQQQQSQSARTKTDTSSYKISSNDNLKPSRSHSPVMSSLSQKPPQPNILRQLILDESKFPVIVPPPPSVRRRTHSLPHGMPAPPVKRQRRIENMEAGENYTTQKRRGRPPRTTSDESSNSETQQPKRIGRPPMAETLARRAQGEKEKAARIPLKFIPFLCEWKRCKAELHNLETLRRHVYVVHTKAQLYKLHCQWGKCSLTSNPKVFNELEELADHVEKEHMVLVAWHMGEGPQSSTLDDKRESDTLAYLSDVNGRIVTPSVVGQKIEYGSARVNHARRLLAPNEAMSMNLKAGGGSAKRVKHPSTGRQLSPTSNFGSLHEVIQRQHNDEVQRWVPPKSLLMGKTSAESMAILKS